MNGPNCRSSGVTNQSEPSAPIAHPSLLDIAQAAAYLGVRERFMRRLVAERRVPFVKIGKFVRFTRGDIDELVSSGRVEQR